MSNLHVQEFAYHCTRITENDVKSRLSFVRKFLQNANGDGLQTNFLQEEPCDLVLFFEQLQQYAFAVAVRATRLAETAPNRRRR